ncbi:hypothetical protein AAMO2058_000214200 [Amorphochlora amoebiformis]
MGSKSSKVSRQKALDEFWRRVRSRELERAVKWIDDHNIDLYDEVDSEREWDAVQWGAYLGDHNFLTAMLDIYQLRCDTHIPDTKIEKFGVSRGATPLHLAAERGNARSIEVLIKKGNADPNPINTHGYSPLHTAALKQRHKSVISLLKCKADVNSSLKYTNNNPNQRLTFTRGSTALHLAIKLNLKRITRILLIYGGDGKYEDDQGLTPDQAAEIGPRSFWDYYSREKEMSTTKSPALFYFSPSSLSLTHAPLSFPVYLSLSPSFPPAPSLPISPTSFFSLILSSISYPFFFLFIFSYIFLSPSLPLLSSLSHFHLCTFSSLSLSLSRISLSFTLSVLNIYIYIYI